MAKKYQTVSDLLRDGPNIITHFDYNIFTGKEHLQFDLLFDWFGFGQTSISVVHSL